MLRTAYKSPLHETVSTTATDLSVQRLVPIHLRQSRMIIL
jgi:hypothetical protein